MAAFSWCLARLLHPAKDRCWRKNLQKKLSDCGSVDSGPNQPLELVENHHLPRLPNFTAANSPKIIEIDSSGNGMEHAFYQGNG
jgi:hypothetical protein